MFPLVALLVVGTAAAEFFDKPYYDLNDAHNLFADFVQEHGKVYHPEEYWLRLEVFKETLIDINERNAMFPETVFAVNRFADLTHEERQAMYGFKVNDEEIERTAMKLRLRPEEITAPEEWDWRKHGAVTRVKDQQYCSSCWIFSAIGAIEGQYAIKYKKQLAFSEQQALDCVQNHENDYHNCIGGLPDWVMAYHEKFGVVLEEGYPYINKQTKCHEDPTKVIANVTSYNVYQPDEETLKQLVYDKGPLSVSIDPSDFTTYHKGILKPKECSSNNVHAVLLVGYGVENGTKYWILKDSAGPEQRDQGYVKLVRGINACSMGTKYTAACTVA